MENNIILETLMERIQIIRKSVERFEKVKRLYPEYLVKQYERIEKELDRIEGYQS